MVKVKRLTDQRSVLLVHRFDRHGERVNRHWRQGSDFE
jgi:hypothetical protein